jgi:hypothetical protein
MVNGTKRSPNLVSVLGHQQMSDFVLVDGIDYMCGNDRDLSVKRTTRFSGRRSPESAHLVRGRFRHVRYTYGLAGIGIFGIRRGGGPGNLAAYGARWTAARRSIRSTSRPCGAEGRHDSRRNDLRGGIRRGRLSRVRVFDGRAHVGRRLRSRGDCVGQIDMRIRRGDVYAAGWDDSSALLWCERRGPRRAGRWKSGRSPWSRTARSTVAGTSAAGTDALLWVRRGPIVLETGIPNTFAS